MLQDMSSQVKPVAEYIFTKPDEKVLIEQKKMVHKSVFGQDIMNRELGECKNYKVKIIIKVKHFIRWHPFQSHVWLVYHSHKSQKG